MKKAKMLPAIVLIGLIGCSGESFTGFDDDAATADVAAGAYMPKVDTPHMVPIKWEFSVEPLPNGVLECLPSGSGVYIPASFSVSGHVSHLGRVDADQSTASFTGCVLGAGTISGDGHATLTGANGDAVELDGVLTLSFADGAMYGIWTITGGTGRFEGASGWIETTETPAPDGSGSVGSGSGMITSPGTLR